jgi:hypothetical protein
MIDLPHHSIDSATHSAISHAVDLMRHYSFELDTCGLEQQMAAWLKMYPPSWISLAVVEALYQGRYKVVSVEQILQIWQRREQPLCHYTLEFERLVRSKISSPIAPDPLPAEPETQAESLLPQPTLSYRTLLLQLPSAKAALKLNAPPLGSPSFQDTVRVNSGANGQQTSPITPSLSNQSTLPGDSDREFQQFKEGVIFALSSSLSNPLLHPQLRLQLSQRYRLNWQHFLESQTPIEQFTPETGLSEFHSKLKSVAEPVTVEHPETDVY